MVLLTNIRHRLQRQYSSYSYYYRPTASSSSSIRTFFTCFQFQLLNDQQKTQKRYLSSSRNTNSFQLDALPFRTSPQEAYTQFQKWADEEQGLGPFLKIGGPIIGSATISAAYTPFWYFDLNVRFVPPSNNGARRGGGASYNNYSNNLVPEPFRTAYPSAPNGTIHIPGLASYAGFSYRRSLIDPVHNTTPLFMGKDITPFGTWMLEPLKVNDAAITGGGEEGVIEIFPDPWNATRERSLNVIYEELVDMANDQYSNDDDDESNNKVDVEIERLRARRIYMPTYIVDYTIVGVTYRAFISGCDASVSVSGISHKTIFSDPALGPQSSELWKGASSFLSQKATPVAGAAVQYFGLRPIVAIAQLGFQLVARLAMKLHIVGLFGGLFVTYQKIISPYFTDKESREKWERQRDHEAELQQSKSYRSFRDYSGSAQQYFTRNRERILRSLGGEEGRREQHEEGNSWYQQWEEWAREQFEQAQREASRAQQEWQRQQQQQQQQQQGGQYQQQQQQQQQEYKQQQQQTGRQYKQKVKEEEFKWDFDVNDPYSVLGVSRGASKEEVSKAFRREMLKHHPDVQANSSEKEKRRATERSKLISDAYRKIKATQKRR